MNNFRTIINENPSVDKLDLHHRVLTMGSCFAEIIGTKLRMQKIDTLINPFGTAYNPYSIHKIFQFAIDNKVELDSGLIKQQDIYFNYDFHSEFSSLTKSDLENKIISTVASTHSFLKSTDWVILTYGTAWVYKRKDTEDVVSNCHKVPVHHFTKSLLTEGEITTSFEGVYKALKKIHPKIKFLLTVSPVRHIKDTIELNSVSKAVLRLACHRITSSCQDVHYFPAYEIMIDDLRDYRFYKSDMIHPSDVAENYIWEKFVDRYANAELKKFLKEWQEILAALAHRPFHPNSMSHQNFLKELIARLDDLKEVVNIDLEKKTVIDQLMQ